MNLRWLVRQNPVTMQELDDYVTTHCVARMDAKAILQRREKPVLQYFCGGEWIDVPTEVLPHEQ
jgi:hypothetical protein